MTTYHSAELTGAGGPAKQDASTASRGADASPVAAPPPRPKGSGASVVGWRATVGAYISLTKPRIIELLLVTTIPTMMLAAGGWPSTWLVLATLVGGAGAAGSANAFNCYLDRDIDAKMSRTKRRVLARQAISWRGAVVFAALLGAVSLAWLWLTVSLAAAALTGAAMLIYVVGYTMILKRRTAQNIVWGGIAGCVPTLVGWVAVTGRLDAPAWLLFGIVFLWTPPHYWPLAMKFRRDYQAAGVPMLPVVAGPKRVAVEVLAYAAGTVVVSVVLVPVAHMGWLYTVAAVAAGAWFVWESAVLARQVWVGAQRPAAMRVFHASITYLSVVFLAVALDPVLHWPL